jgi:hypothetical protein
MLPDSSALPTNVPDPAPPKVKLAKQLGPLRVYVPEKLALKAPPLGAN